jgi:hypothetical protein
MTNKRTFLSFFQHPTDVHWLEGLGATCTDGTRWNWAGTVTWQLITGYRSKEGRVWSSWRGEGGKLKPISFKQTLGLGIRHNFTSEKNLKGTPHLACSVEQLHSKGSGSWSWNWVCVLSCDPHGVACFVSSDVKEGCSKSPLLWIKTQQKTPLALHGWL